MGINNNIERIIAAIEAIEELHAKYQEKGTNIEEALNEEVYARTLTEYMEATSPSVVMSLISAASVRSEQEIITDGVTEQAFSEALGVLLSKAVEIGRNYKAVMYSPGLHEGITVSVSFNDAPTKELQH